MGEVGARFETRVVGAVTVAAGETTSDTLCGATVGTGEVAIKGCFGPTIPVATARALSMMRGELETCMTSRGRRRREME